MNNVELTNFSPLGRRRSLFSRLNTRFPALKIVLIIFVFIGVSGFLIFNSFLTGGNDQNKKNGSSEASLSLENIGPINNSDQDINEKKTDDNGDADSVADDGNKDSNKGESDEDNTNEQADSKRDLTGKKLVALSFDDGPSSATTPRLLDFLNAKHVKADFFALGSMANKNPDILKREYNDGHEVNNHSMWHKNWNRVPQGEAVADLNDGISAIRGILGVDPVYTRPPYGNIPNTVSKTMKTPYILWTVDTLDWKSKDVASVRKVANDTVFDGAIILMHDIYQSTVDAVPLIIDDLRSKGYEFVTVSEMAEIRGKTMVNGVGYGSFRP